MQNTVESSSKPMNTRDTLDRRFCVAPMMDWTDRHCRAFHRTLSKHAVLYTEMVTTGAIIFGDQERHLAFNDTEHPVALQLGGSNPEELAKSCQIAERYGYDEINLNVGCPSDRVQNNMIGACLMAHPELVKDCMIAMREATQLPVTIKHRLGIDDLDNDQHLHNFVATVAESGCKTFIVHARKAILAGLSPKENRDVPPLQYDRVYKLKALFPDLEIIINGGIKTLSDSETHLQHVDGVMLGREAYHNPYLMADVDHTIYEAPSAEVSRSDILRNYVPYIEQQLSLGVPLNHISRHILGLFHGVRGGKQFRRHISEQAHKPGAMINVILDALDKVHEEPKKD